MPYCTITDPPSDYHAFLTLKNISDDEEVMTAVNERF